MLKFCFHIIMRTVIEFVKGLIIPSKGWKNIKIISLVVILDFTYKLFFIELGIYRIEFQYLKFFPRIYL